MPARFQVEIEPEQGYALAGGARFALERREDGTLLIDGSSRLRPVSFAERSSLIIESLFADDVSAALAESIASRTVIDAGNVSADALRVLSLVLAGGGVEDISFTEAAHRASERRGWSWEQTLAAPAWEVDRAAETEGDNGWSTFVFPTEVDMQSLAAEMSANLLRRSVEPLPEPSASVSMRQDHSGSSTIASAQTATNSPARTRSVSAAPSLPVRSTAQPAASLANPRPATPLKAPQSKMAPIARATNISSPPASTSAAKPNTSIPPRWSKPAQLRTLPSLAGPTPATITRPLKLDTHRTTGALAAQPISSIDLSPLPVPPPSRIADRSAAHHAAWTTQSAPSEASPSHAAAPQAIQDWMLSLALALEAECDLRGID